MRVIFHYQLQMRWMILYKYIFHSSVHIRLICDSLFGGYVEKEKFQEGIYLSHVDIYMWKAM